MQGLFYRHTSVYFVWNQEKARNIQVSAVFEHNSLHHDYSCNNTPRISQISGASYFANEIYERLNIIVERLALILVRSLQATTFSSSSYFFDRGAAHGTVTTPQRLGSRSVSISLQSKKSSLKRTCFAATYSTSCIILLSKGSWRPALWSLVHEAAP